jgi:hypothetical protein
MLLSFFICRTGASLIEVVGEHDPYFKRVAESRPDYEVDVSFWKKMTARATAESRPIQFVCRICRNIVAGHGIRAAGRRGADFSDMKK